MKSILVVNGEKYWQDFLPGIKVEQKAIQHSSWILREGNLFVTDQNGVSKPDGILWRVGAIKPSELQTIALNLIEIAGIPCVNSPQTLKIGYDRLSMLSCLKRLQLPVIDFNVATKSTHLKNIQIGFPFVVKVGNYHGGYGKVLVETEKQWQDIKDLLFVTDHYITIEPYIHYKYDIRYLAINDKVWAMSRRGTFWKANINTRNHEVIAPQKDLSSMVLKLKEHLQADIVAIDLLEEDNGQIHIVEYNDIPGLSGFPAALKYEMANVITAKMAID